LPPLRSAHAASAANDRKVSTAAGWQEICTLQRRKAGFSPMRPDHNRDRLSCSKVIALPDPTAAQHRSDQSVLSS